MSELILQANWITWLHQIDVGIFNWINHDLQNPMLDKVMPWWREKEFWIPLYLALAGFLFYRYRLKALYYLLLVGATVGLADTLSSKVVKPLVGRERPCQAEPFRTTVSLKLDHCGAAPSFTSSHATNHFALAALWVFTLPFLRRWGKRALWFWAASIAFGQVYVGVHYPFDVLGGALLGTGTGSLGSWFYRKWPPKFRLAP